MSGEGRRGGALMGYGASGRRSKQGGSGNEQEEWEEVQRERDKLLGVVEGDIYEFGVMACQKRELYEPFHRPLLELDFPEMALGLVMRARGFFKTTCRVEIR